MPGTSRLAVAVRGGVVHDGWDVHAYLLAAVVNAVQANTHALVQVNSRRRIPPPNLVPLPGQPRRTGRTVRVADLPGARPSPG
ncbi:hypothetical protein [Virgisporangium aliadipatigenens]|uniref:hypothetical protein n=1 Tax=Virgisporangium aliadipatigenens TaxID=741659 RepID=UPI001EF377E7|nr:hypothetical protein [Virgisporangium aliadipatigenens]